MPSQLFKIRPNRSRCFRLLLILIVPIVVGLSSASASSLRLQTDGSEDVMASGGHEAREFFTESNPVENFQSIPGHGEINQSTVAISLNASSNISLFGYQTKTLSGPPWQTITFNLQNFTLTGHSTLTLFGDSTATLIFNVTQQFSLAGSARIVLSGGIQWNHVFFNVLGSGSAVSLSEKTALSGTLTASQRIVRMTDHAIVYGKVLAQKLAIRQAAQIITPPVVSQ
jgi:ice-binding like protein